MKRIQFVIVLLLTSIIAKSEDWKKFDNDDKRFQSYYTKIKDSKFYKYKHIVVFDISLERIKKVVTNFDTYTKWYVDCIDSKILKVTSDIEGYVYSKNDLPWPYDNRDVIYKFDNVETQDKFVSTFKSKPDFIKEDEDSFRIKDSHGKWTLTRLSGDKTKLEYEIYVNPGNSLPASVANDQMAETQLESLRNLENYSKSM